MKAIKSVLLFGRALLPDFEAMEKADDLSAEIDDFKEALENHFDGCDVLQIKLSLVILKLLLLKLIRF